MTTYMDHEQGKTFLLQVSGVLDTLSIPYFLLQGTALGAYRDRGFVPTERDIDIGILIENFRAGDICKSLIERNYEVETRARHTPFQFAHTIVVYKDGIKADLVGLIKYKEQRFTCTPDIPAEILEPYAIVHESALLEIYREIELFGRTFLIPHDIETYLEREYGPGWRTPKEDHISRTRVYNYLETLPSDFLNLKPF